ncbi:MAG: hypothetical protein F6K61_17185 [Sphaerospermopsis sp. SIO1G1]|nr:hypothetical protein [Sphaerospermopsis sp. SIO1G1]
MKIDQYFKELKLDKEQAETVVKNVAQHDPEFSKLFEAEGAKFAQYLQTGDSQLIDQIDVVKYVQSPPVESVESSTPTDCDLAIAIAVIRVVDLLLDVLDIEIPDSSNIDRAVAEALIKAGIIESLVSLLKDIEEAAKNDSIHDFGEAVWKFLCKLYEASVLGKILGAMFSNLNFIDAALIVGKILLAMAAAVITDGGYFIVKLGELIVNTAALSAAIAKAQEACQS